MLTQKPFDRFAHTFQVNCAFWSSSDNPGDLKLFWRHLAEINAKNSPNLLKIPRVDSTELPCLSYLKNPGQLPVQGYLKGTDTCILWIFTISSLFMFSRSRNPLLTFLLSYNVWVTSIIQVNFRFERYWWFCLMNFGNFHTIRVFEVRESIDDISTELPCLDNLENPGRLPVQDALGGTGECVL